MANNAFDAMNGAAGKDMYITGGSIFNSDYENNMSPADQKEYENTILNLFQTAYQNDPLAEKYPNVSFKHWLTTIDGEDWRLTASDYSNIRHKGEGSDFTYAGEGSTVGPGDYTYPQDLQTYMYEAPEQYSQEEQIYLIESLSHLHTGKIEDLIEIVGNLESRGDVGASAARPSGNLNMRQTMAPMAGKLAPKAGTPGINLPAEE